MLVGQALSADRSPILQIGNASSELLLPIVMSLVLFALLLSMRSIWRQAKQVQAARAQVDAAEMRVRELRGLLDLLTHDMASPLFIIQSLAELNLSKAQPDNLLRVPLEKIQATAEAATAILKTVRELEAIELGKLKLELKPIAIIPALLAAIAILQAKAEAKGVRIDLLSSPASLDGLAVLGEKTILEHTIFHNILSNALKFSKPGSVIEIQIECPNPSQVLIRFKDQGIGMPKELTERIFSHCSYTNRRGTAGEKGTGLGLPLVARYVEKFSGKITVSSRSIEEFPDQHGSEFEVSLQRAV
jgi:signal transduction histidine kinase